MVVAQGKPVAGSLVRLTSDVARTSIVPVQEIRAGRADHEPTAGRCQMTTWHPGHHVADRFTAKIDKSDHTPSGQYDVWTGFITGFALTWFCAGNANGPDAGVALRSSQITPPRHCLRQRPFGR